MNRSLLAIALALGAHTALAVNAPVAHLEWTGSGLTLSWSAVPGTETYAIYSMTVPYGSGALLERVPADQLEYFQVVGGTGFYYVVAEDTVPDPAPHPTAPADSVISLFSNAYTNVPVDTWSTGWDSADLQDLQLAGNDTKLYTNLVFAGIEFTSQTIDATEMTRFHLDIFTPDASAAPAFFRVKLVDFGANGVWGGGDDVEHELLFDDASNPPLQSNTWVSLDLPLSSFVGLSSRAHLAQLILSSSTSPAVSTVYLDNVYFYDDGTVEPTEPVPTVAAPTPTVPAEDVISLFSDAYTNHPVGSWSMFWDVADVTDTLIAGNATKHYTNMVYAGIEFASPTVDATDMTRFHLDLWVPGPTAPPAQFGIKLVDWGANGVWGGGDDVEHEVWINSSSTPPLQSESWLSCDLALSSFGGLLTRGHLAQLIIEGLPAVYVDNVYFWDDGSVIEPPAEPTEPAPTPTYEAANVISLFSNAYINVAVDTWSAVWDVANVADLQILGNDTKLYSGLVYAGIEFTSQTIDATGMTHFRLDYWTPDPTAAPAVFRIKLVDFGADGSYAGGDDVEHELSFTATSTPALQTASWVSFDIPLSEFTNLVTQGHVAQLIISGSTPTAYIDNVLFHQ
ncbi:MAG: hypothetical protein WC326_00130 [Candidatus Delongbacteria bacterium]